MSSYWKLICRYKAIGKLLFLFVTLIICGLYHKAAPATAWAAVKPVVQGQGSNSNSKSVYWLDVNQDTQLLKVMKGNSPVRVVIVSTGKTSTPTPNGTFQVQNRGPFFSVDFASAKYFTSFKGWGKYMFHSIIFDKRGKQIIASAAERLGFKASHGCIRMPIHDAYWIYKNIPAGTKVVIHSTNKTNNVKTKKLPVFSLEVNGNKVKFSQKPRWVAGTLMVPSKDLASWIGANIEWNSREVSASLVKQGQRWKFPVSIPQLLVADHSIALPIPALLIHKTIWLPFEATVTALGYQTQWSAKQNQLTAIKKTEGALANTIFINGRPLGLQRLLDTEQGQLLVPITEISQALGAMVSQAVYQERSADSPNQQFYTQLMVTLPDRDVIFSVDSCTYSVNGVSFISKIPVRDKQGQYYMGLQDFATAIGLETIFKDNTIQINTKRFVSDELL